MSDEVKKRTVYHASLGVKPEHLATLKRVAELLSKQAGVKVSGSSAAGYCFDLALKSLQNK